MRSYCPENFKKLRRQLCAHFTCTGGEDAQGKGEPPPADVERKALASNNGCQGEEEPDKCEGPENQSDQETYRVEDVAR